MPPGYPPHPGQLLRDAVLPALALSVKEAARELLISRQTLHRILAGTASITPDMAVRLGRLSGLAAREWLALQQAYDLRKAEISLAEVLEQITPRDPVPALQVTFQQHLSGL